MGLLYLLPLGLEEVRRFDRPPRDLWTTVWTGGYPRIHDRGLDAGEWLADYVATYVQRDVRQALNVTSLDAFTQLLRLAAARTARELSLTGLGGDAGVSHNTARSWLSVLEASFVVFRVPRWHRNLRKRAVKAAKLHFVDSGLACQLLGIRSPEQLALHPLRGAVFESWVAAELLKARLHAGRPADLFHIREDRGLDLDLVVEAGDRVYGVEVKSGATVVPDFLHAPSRFADGIAGDLPHLRPVARLVYGGDRRERRGAVEVIPWTDVQAADW